MAYLLQQLAIWYAALFLSVAAHECGHWAAARAMGMPVRRVEIGGGPPLLQGYCGRTSVSWRLWPFGGFVAAVWLVDSTRIRRLAFVVSGALANALMIVAAACLDAAGLLGRFPGTFMGPIACTQVYMALAVLVPSTTPQGPSDGKQILRLLFGPRSDALRAALLEGFNVEVTRRYFGADALASPRTPAVDRVVTLLTTPTDVDPDRARNLARELGSELPPAIELAALDTVVTEALLCEPPDDTPELNRWLARLDALDPGVPTLAGTRGSLLVRLGRAAEGRALLLPLAAADDPFDRAMSNVFLAIAEASLGSTDAARHRLRVAIVAARSEAPPRRRLIALIERTTRHLGEAIGPPD